MLTFREQDGGEERRRRKETRSTDLSQTILAKTQNEKQQESNRIKVIKKKDFSTGDRIIIQKI